MHYNNNNNINLLNIIVLETYIDIFFPFSSFIIIFFSTREHGVTGRTLAEIVKLIHREYLIILYKLYLINFVNSINGNNEFRVIPGRNFQFKPVACGNHSV